MSPSSFNYTPPLYHKTPNIMKSNGVLAKMINEKPSTTQSPTNLTNNSNSKVRPYSSLTTTQNNNRT